MSAREIPPHEWRGFLEGFALRHRAWLASVRQRPHGGREITRAAERPLAGVDAQPRRGDVEDVVIQFAGAAKPIHVQAPKALRVDISPRGEEVALEMENAGGVTRLSFRAGALPEELDGISAGETMQGRK